LILNKYIYWKLSANTIISDSGSYFPYTKGNINSIS
jgi:hypothetical protein